MDSYLDERLESSFDDAVTGYEFEAINDSGKYSGEASYDDLHFVVHPGWTAKNYELDWEEEDRKDLFLQKFYSDYIHQLGEVFDETGPREPVHIIYSEGGKSHAQTIIEQLGGAEIEGFTQSKEDSGEVPEDNFENVLQSVDRMHPDGEITVHGEINGRCSSVFQRQLEENTIPDIEVNEGVTFPPEPSWNYVFTTNTWHK